MDALPDLIGTVAELEEVLERPSQALVEFMGRIEGDLMILGAGGKVGPSLAGRAWNAIKAAGVDKRLVAVDLQPIPSLEAKGIETLGCDMLDLEQVRQLPQIENIVYMIGRKFGSTGSEHLTWGINVIAAYNAASVFTKSRIAAFSTGCVYPVMHVNTGGATEQTPPNPVGEYAMSCLGRERMFDFFSQTAGAKVLHFRLNYSVELRYGVLVDVAQKVLAGEPVDVTTGFANVLWQGDACDQALRSVELANSPARALNVTGPETLSIRDVALEFGRIFDKDVSFSGEENGFGYLSNARQANTLFGNPEVPIGKAIQWIAHWTKSGGEDLGKATHFETQDGKY